MLSRYKITERIGAGGMGIVHRAEDRKLKRPVAIKFLSEEAFKKKHVRARFHREARLSASLNHPNICIIHEVGEAVAGEEQVLGGKPLVPAGTPFLVMELIEGQALDEVLEEKSPLPLPELLEIALQIANGMAEAHAHSIVHRDLKPKNVMITTSRQAKILDFGMAKPLMPAADDDKTMKTTEALSMELTREGMVLGTVAYMSPEQATGKAVDSRSDVFSFGIMLYEMATGKRPFQGDSYTSTLAKILETEPGAIAESREGLPHELSRIITRCLRKHPDDRYNDTRDLSVALKDLMHETSSAVVRRLEASGTAPRAVEAAPVPKPRLPTWAGVAAGVLLGLAAGALVVPRFLSPARSFVAPSFEQITFTGSASFPTLSPDGQSLAYATLRPSGGSQVVIQDLTGGQQLSIFDAAWIRSLRWSPTGSELLVSGSSIANVTQSYLVSRLGGSTRPLRYLPFVAWSPEGDRFAGATLSGKQIVFTETSTGAASSIELTGEFSFIYEIDWSPGGRVLALRTSDESNRHAIWTTTLDGATQQIVIEGKAALHSARFAPGGDAIYYLSGDEQVKALYKIGIDPGTGKAEGEPLLLMSGLQAGEQITFSEDGRQLLYAREVTHSNIWLIDRRGDGVTTSQLTRGTFHDAAPRFSPDGSRLALVRKSRAEPNLFVLSLDDRQSEQLTFLSSDIWQPVWSPDGKELAFGATTDGAAQVWKIGARGGTPHTFAETSLSQDLAWGSGSKIIYQRPGDSALHFLEAAGGKETVFVDGSGGGAADPLQFFSWMASPEYSPDGEQIAFSCNCPEGEGIFVASVRDSSRRRIHPDSETLPVGWAADGSAVFAREPDSLDLLRIPTGGGKAATHVTIPFERIGDVDITPDGTRIAVAVPVTQADIWRIENFDPSLR